MPQNSHNPHDHRPRTAARDHWAERAPATPDQGTRLRRAVSAWVKAHGADDRTADDMVLAVGEALANVVDHAYPAGEVGPMTITVSLDPTRFTVTIADEGRWPEGAGKPQAHRGRGLMIIRAVAAENVITRTDSGTTVVLRWPRPSLCA